jgi:VWFA-related protein
MTLPALLQLRLGAVGLAVAIALALWASPPEQARAGEPLPSLVVNQLDSDAYPDLTAVVTVLDASGSPAPGLTAASFTAQAGEDPVEVLDAQRVLDTSLTLSVVLVMDVSGSMEGAPLASAKQAATAFVEQLDPGDQAALIAFSDQVRVVVDFTEDKAALSGAIAALQAVGATSLYEAVQVAAVVANSSDAERRAIVMLSDGENDTTSPVTEADSLGSAAGARLPYFAIGFGSGADPAYLGTLAERSGGRYFSATGTDVAAVYATIADQLRGQYALALRAPAPADGAESQLTVSATVSGRQVSSPPVAFARGAAPVAPEPTAAPTDPQPAEDDGGGNPALAFVLLGLIVVPVVGVAALLLVRRTRESRRQRERERGAGRQSDAPLPQREPVAAAAEEDEREATVTALSGEQAGTAVRFGRTPIVFGSDAAADVRIPRSQVVAPRHAMLWVRGGKIMLRHTGGPRPTLSGGRPVDWLILEEGDEFAIGPQKYRVSGGSANGAAAGEPASAGTDASS